MQYDFSKLKEYKLYQVLRFVAVIFCLRYKVNYIGLENVPKDKGLILACNHQSGVDPIILGRGVKRTIHFMAKEELFENNALGLFLKHLNAFPVRRGQGDTASVEFAQEIVKNGYILGIFPEGTRSKDFKPSKRGKSGTALIAKQTGADVLPVCIYTCDEYKKGTRLTVHFGKVIKNEEFGFSDEHSPKELRDATKRIMGDITALWEEGHCGK